MQMRRRRRRKRRRKREGDEDDDEGGDGDDYIGDDLYDEDDTDDVDDDLDLYTRLKFLKTLECSRRCRGQADLSPRKFIGVLQRLR